MFSSSLMASEVPGTISSPSDVKSFSDMVEGQAMVRQDRGFDPIVWMSSVANYIEMWVIVKKSSPKNLSANCRSTVGRQLTDRLPTVYRQLTNRLPTG